MGDVITFLQFLQKLEQGRLIPTEQIEHLSDILKSTLRKTFARSIRFSRRTSRKSTQW